MPEEDTPQKEEREKHSCLTEDCKADVEWEFPYPDHTEHFCAEHTYEAMLNHAAMNVKSYQPIFFKAHSIEVENTGYPVPLYIFVCQVGHIGRIFLLTVDEKRMDIISFFRDCNYCDEISEDLCQVINDALFQGKGKWQHRKTRRNIDVA